jgi:hypothetical protein
MKRLHESQLEERVRTRSKKDRKRWCKGKTGREHKYGEWESVLPDLKLTSPMYQRLCSECGKKDIVCGADTINRTSKRL